VQKRLGQIVLGVALTVVHFLQRTGTVGRPDGMVRKLALLSHPGAGVQSMALSIYSWSHFFPPC
jgi:hypothetical protein